MIVILIFFLALSTLCADQMEPSEPDIILPEIILRIEDLSVDIVEAGLPDEAELLAPERDIPLPEEEELHIEEPAYPEYIADSHSLFQPEQGRSLTAEGLLGLGSMNHIVSMISLYRVGDEPRFKLKFLHEMLDGFAAKDPGSGFNIREDSLQGGIKFHIGNLGIDAKGELEDLEKGLQGQSPFTSGIFRHGDVDIDFEYPFGDRFNLSGALESGFSSRMLTGSVPISVTEFLTSLKLTGIVNIEIFRFGLKSRYKYRALPGQEDNQLHRFSASGLFGVDFAGGFALEGSGGWMWNSDLGNLFPFELTFSGTPFSSLTFRVSGGYRVNELDFRNIFSDYDLISMPDVLHDNHGWFGDLGLSLSLLRDLSMQSRAVFSRNSFLPDPVPDTENPSGLSPDTGLFPFRQIEADCLSTYFGIKWNILNFITLRAGLESEFLERPGFTPQHILLLDGEGAGSSAKWGGKGSVKFRFGHTEEAPLWEYSLIPEVSLRAYYKITDTMTLIGEGEDLLSPLIEGPRTTWFPFQDPGIRATVKIQITM